MKSDVIRALLLEIEFQKNYLEGSEIETIYFGGGTPSVLEERELEMIINQIKNHHTVTGNAEITLEANPDDINAEKIAGFKSVGINRLSLGVQSFNQDDLDYMGRVHSSTEAIKAIELIKDTGFENITVDLIFGTPTLSDKDLFYNLEQLDRLKINHISAYGLTAEKNTILSHQIKKKLIEAPNDENQARQFRLVDEYLSDKEYQHYEISNYAKKGYHSKHNSNYWNSIPYLGIGPSAHSFDGKTRRWNVSNNARYIKAINANDAYYELEILSDNQKLNEYIMLGLRTSKGLNLGVITSQFGRKIADRINTIARTLNNDTAYLLIQNDVIKLTKEGMLYADAIASEMFEV